MLVEPAVLRELASELDTNSDQIEAIDPRGLDALSESLMGSALARAAAEAQPRVWQALSNISTRVGQMAYLVRGANQDYVSTDVEVGSGFAAMGDFG